MDFQAKPGRAKSEAISRSRGIGGWDCFDARFGCLVFIACVTCGFVCFGPRKAGVPACCGCCSTLLHVCPSNRKIAPLSWLAFALNCRAVSAMWNLLANERRAMPMPMQISGAKPRGLEGALHRGRLMRLRLRAWRGENRWMGSGWRKWWRGAPDLLALWNRKIMSRQKSIRLMQGFALHEPCNPWLHLHPRVLRCAFPICLWQAFRAKPKKANQWQLNPRHNNKTRQATKQA